MDSLDGVSSTLALRRLSVTLRKYRLQMGTLRVADVAKAAGLSQPSWSQVENGLTVPTHDHLAAAMPALEIDGDAADELLALRERAKVVEWWQSYGDDVARPSLLKLIGFEASAVSIRHCSSGWVPGLLQTPEWAQASLQVPGIPIRTENIPLAVELRMRRQGVLDRPNFTHHAVCGEEALRYQPGGRQVQLDQLRHLLDVVRSNDRITLQATPFSSGLHVGHSAPYSVISFANPADTPLVQLEHASALFSDAPAEVRHWSFVFDNLTRAALSPDETVRLIEQIIKESP